MNSLLNREYQEKRNFIRMKIDTPAQVSINNGDDTHEGICKELSGGGMLLELDTTFPVGSELKVTISSGHGHAPMLEALTRVLRVDAKPGSESQPCTMGLEILKVIN